MHKRSQQIDRTIEVGD